MSDVYNAKGGCLCGAVEVIAKSISSNVGVCHCDMCRKWTGGPLMAVDGGIDVVIEGIENVSVYNSSDWAERVFCKKCGSHLFYRLKESNQHIIPVGIFDTDIPFVLDHQIFIDSKPPYYHFGNNTKEMTGEEVFAQYAPPSE